MFTLSIWEDHGRRVGVALSVLLIAALMGCSAAAPHREIVVAEQAVDEAIESDAVDHAPLELELARERLDQAKEAVHEEEYVEARRLAEEATADAKLASAKSSAKKAREDRPVEVLIQEESVIEDTIIHEDTIIRRRR